MRKIVISIALLGVFSIGSMAFIRASADEPPVRRSEVRHGGYGSHEHHGERYGRGRQGGCCGRYRCDDSRRDYDCCDGRYRCGACYDDHCTVDGCHESGKLCPQCAEWLDSHRRDRARRVR